jgi:hypothetical protein
MIDMIPTSPNTHPRHRGLPPPHSHGDAQLPAWLRVVVDDRGQEAQPRHRAVRSALGLSRVYVRTLRSARLHVPMWQRGLVACGCCVLDVRKVGISRPS